MRTPKAEKDEIIALLKNLTEYYNLELSSNIVNLYIATLDDFSFEVLRQAALLHVKETAYFPHINDLRKLARRVKFEMDYLQPDDSDYYDFHPHTP